MISFTDLKGYQKSIQERPLYQQLVAMVFTMKTLKIPLGTYKIRMTEEFYEALVKEQEPFITETGMKRLWAGLRRRFIGVPVEVYKHPLPGTYLAQIAPFNEGVLLPLIDSLRLEVRKHTPREHIYLEMKPGTAEVLALCEDCRDENSLKEATHEEVSLLWAIPITWDEPAYCDNCGVPVVAYDTP